MAVSIAMWSGPRNLSTAMMRSFSSRSDCAVWDEPFYAVYLARTGLDHPLRDAVLAAWEQDPAKIAKACTGPVPDGKSVFYQKHMTHHMLEDFDLSWISKLTNVFLIRHPARVVASYLAKRENPTFEDLGFLRQAELFERACEFTGRPPAVIDCDAILGDPASQLELLCRHLGIAFESAMLHWPKGPHPADGPWAPHWYGSLWRSTGFSDPPGALPQLDRAGGKLAASALSIYDHLSRYRIDKNVTDCN